MKFRTEHTIRETQSIQNQVCSGSIQVHPNPPIYKISMQVQAPSLTQTTNPNYVTMSAADEVQRDAVRALQDTFIG